MSSDNNMAKQKYRVEAEQVDSEQLPVRLTIPIEVLKEKKGAFVNYHAGIRFIVDTPYQEAMGALWAKGVPIPEDFEWKGFISEHILELSALKDSGYRLVDAVEDFRVDKKGLAVRCLVSDPNWNH